MKSKKKTFISGKHTHHNAGFVKNYQKIPKKTYSNNLDIKKVTDNRTFSKTVEKRNDIWQREVKSTQAIVNST